MLAAIIVFLATVVLGLVLRKQILKLIAAVSKDDTWLPVTPDAVDRFFGRALANRFYDARIANGTQCLAGAGARLFSKPCDDKDKAQRFSWNGRRLGHWGRCIDGNLDSKVCADDSVDQTWLSLPGGKLKHFVSGKCLDISNTNDPVMIDCASETDNNNLKIVEGW